MDSLKVTVTRVQPIKLHRELQNELLSLPNHLWRKRQSQWARSSASRFEFSKSAMEAFASLVADQNTFILNSFSGNFKEADEYLSDSWEFIEPSQIDPHQSFQALCVNTFGHPSLVLSLRLSLEKGTVTSWTKQGRLFEMIACNLLQNSAFASRFERNGIDHLNDYLKNLLNSDSINAVTVDSSIRHENFPYDHLMVAFDQILPADIEIELERYEHPSDIKMSELRKSGVRYFCSWGRSVIKSEEDNDSAFAAAILTFHQESWHVLDFFQNSFTDLQERIWNHPHSNEKSASEFSTNLLFYQRYNQWHSNKIASLPPKFLKIAEQFERSWRLAQKKHQLQNAIFITQQIYSAYTNEIESKKSKQVNRILAVVAGIQVLTFVSIWADYMSGFYSQAPDNPHFEWIAKWSLPIAGSTCIGFLVLLKRLHPINTLCDMLFSPCWLSLAWLRFGWKLKRSTFPTSLKNLYVI